jgi:hypothetical protein
MLTATICGVNDEITGFDPCPAGGCFYESTFERRVACVKDGVIYPEDKCKESWLFEPNIYAICFPNQCFTWKCLKVNYDDNSYTFVDCSDEETWSPCVHETCDEGIQYRYSFCIFMSGFGGEYVMTEEYCLRFQSKPQFTRDCVPTIGISEVFATPRQLVAGGDVALTWECFAGPQQNLQFALERKTDTNIPLGVALSTAKTIDVTVPGTFTGETRIVVTQQSGDNGFCDEVTGGCVCATGYSGPTCMDTACDACIESHSTCSVAEGVCHCHAGWTGASCSNREDCPNADKCQNGGYLSMTDDVCDTECTCMNKWTGSVCDTCGHECGDNGIANDACTSCKCDCGYSGDTCQCRGAYGFLNYPNLPVANADANFFTMLKADIAVTAFVPVSKISISDYRARLDGIGTRVIVMLSVCSGSDTAFMATSTAFSSTASSTMEDIYAAWELITTNLDDSASTMASGDASTYAGGGVAAEPMYDTVRDGQGCPAGVKPYEKPGEPAPAPASAASSFPVGIVVGASAGGLILIVIVAFFIYRRYFGKRAAPIIQEPQHVNIGEQKALESRYSLQPATLVGPILQVNPQSGAATGPRSAGMGTASVEMVELGSEMTSTTGPSSGDTDSSYHISYHSNRSDPATVTRT